jgi:F0F1-type ATP synthase assembly protein I
MERIAAFFEREAGHVVVSLILIIFGAALWKFGVPKGEDLIPFALGVLGRSMIGSKKEAQA